MLFIFHKNTPTTLEAGLDAALAALIFGQDVDVLFFDNPYQGPEQLCNEAYTMIREKLILLKQSGLNSVYSPFSSVENDDALPLVTSASNDVLQKLMHLHSPILSF